ncbi:hypothetical protein [Companilactobacillus sp. HBUAS56275]|uniref:YfhO family protein n=1 Tax=Candidatus Companilactobacillus pullicola TaxID=2838523 RepID=A0A9D1ZN37_9LACO|nr:hypothetical protein [Candidatus Companilactobacillus pullicola]
MSSRSWRRVIIGVIFLILTIFYTSLFLNHAAVTNELIFNIAHIKSLSSIFVSPINFDYWGHTGSLINLYSPWLTILPGILFLNQNVIIGFLIIISLITYATLVSSYYYMKKFSGDTLESLLFAVIYTLSFNRFWLIFGEQRIENYLVLIFLPMVYYGAFQIFNGQFQDWLTLTLGMSLIIWTSPYMALAVVLTLIPVLPLMIFSRLSHHWLYWGKTLLNLLKAALTTCLLTIGYWGPMLENQWPKKVLQQSRPQFDYWSWFDKNFLTQNNQYLFFIMIALLALVVFFIFLKSSFSYKILILESLVIAALLLIRPQFQIDTSRLIFAITSVLDFFAIMILIRVILLLFQERSAVIHLLILLVTIGGFGYLTYNQANEFQPQRKIQFSQKIDYKNLVVNYHDQSLDSKNHFLIDGHSSQVQFNTKDNQYWLQYYNPKSVTMDIPVQNYSGNKVTVNNESVKLYKSKRGTLSLKTDPNKNIIEIHSHHTILATVFLLINLFSFIGFGYIYFSNKWRSNKKIMAES